MRGRAQPVKPVKPQSRKSTVKSAATGNNNSTTPKSLCSVKPYPTCVDCGVNITDSVQALQCDRCCDDSSWKCGECLGLSAEVYESLLSNAGCELRWFCGSCNKQITSQHDCITEKLDVISKTVDKLMDRLDSIEMRLDSVKDSTADGTVTAKLDDMDKRIEHIVDRLQAVDVKLDTKADSSQSESGGRQLLEVVQQRLEHKVDELRTNLDEPVAQAVQGVLQQDKAEEMEINKRKENVIIHGVPESQDENSDHRLSDDLAVLSAMFHEVGVENAKVENMVRLGRRPSDPIQNPRPMKVVMDSVESKIRLLKKAKNLRENQEGEWCRIVIHQDLTPKQREARKPLVAELKQRKAQGEQDLVIFNGKVVKRRGARPSQAN